MMLQKIPSHWKTISLHYIARLKSGESITALEFDQDGEFPVFGGNGFRGKCDRYTHDGSFVLIGRQGALCGNVNIAHGKFFASEHAIAVNPEWAFNTNWMAYLLQAMNLNQYSVSAAQPGLSSEVIGRLKIVFPPIGEQEAIALFLDFKASQIDALIAKQRALLEKLAEKRTSMINRVVTKGIDPTVPMKNSGVAWLGEIPAHWKTIALHYVGRLKSGESITALQFNEEGEYPVFGGNGYRGNYDRYTHDGNYVLIGRQGALCGNINIAKGRFFASEHAIVVNPEWEFDTNWMAYQLLSMNLNQYSESAAQPGLSAEVIGRLKVAFPAIDEQQRIARLLDEKAGQIQAQQQRIEDVISRLQDYRSALITNAVTGSIDVRNLPILWTDDLPASESEA